MVYSLYLKKFKEHVEEMRGDIHHLDRLFLAFGWGYSSTVVMMKKTVLRFAICMYWGIQNVPDECKHTYRWLLEGSEPAPSCSIAHRASWLCRRHLVSARSMNTFHGEYIMQIALCSTQCESIISPNDCMCRYVFLCFTMHNIAQ